MIDGSIIESNDFSIDNENLEIQPQGLNQDQNDENDQGRVTVVDAEIRRRLEAELEERELQKMIQDYDFDLD